MTDPGSREQIFSTRADDFHIVVAHYGNGKGTREAFQQSSPDMLSDVTNTLDAVADFMGNEVFNRLNGIINDLADAWQGAQADNATALIKVLQGDATAIHDNASTISSQLVAFQKSWNGLRDQAGNLGDDDDATAKTIFDNFTAAEDTAMRGMPSQLVAHVPLSGRVTAPNTNTKGGNTKDGNGNGLGDGNHDQFGGGGGLGGLPTGSGDVKFDPKGLGGLGGGGSSLAGVGGLGAPHAAGTVGAGAEGVGGLGGGAAGVGGVGAGAGGAAGSGAGGSGFLPPFGGGGGGGNDEQERERSTWLNEDDDIWGGGDAPSSLIT